MQDRKLLVDRFKHRLHVGYPRRPTVTGQRADQLIVEHKVQVLVNHRNERQRIDGWRLLGDPLGDQARDVRNIALGKRRVPLEVRRRMADRGGRRRGSGAFPTKVQRRTYSRRRRLTLYDTSCEFRRNWQR